ncbi:hypothetical protein B0H16DRAFT_1717038 [Mycena metata]|uniref:Uncharacterized protein n=1 Tax=Mycena metata TaxID=1033252 RepID=A0AAD7JLR4_9AGAR|nr:hypothetical protein B0H16DRAFT_1717038 [Mycena metata]
MQSNNTSHYREHTRQQDGWTVLAPPPQQAGDLPPPYPPDAPALAPVQAAAAGTAGTNLIFQIPINSNIIGATPVTRAKTYGADVPFAVGYNEICTIMGLDVATACIGYKWDNEKANIPTHALSNATDWKNCLENGIGQTKRARSRIVMCIIKNLNLPVETAGGLALTASTKGGNPKKRKSGGSYPDEKKTFDFTRQYRDLKSHLQCATHKGDLCWVSTMDGSHHRVDAEHTTLWAKEISVGNSDMTRPPENIMFQDFFLPQRKRARTTRPESSTNPCAPTIHVTVNTGGTGTGSANGLTLSPQRRSPLGTITNTNIATSASPIRPDDLAVHQSANVDRGFEVYYPSVAAILQQIDDSGEFADSVPFPTVIFTDALEESQITQVDHVPVFNTEYYVQDIHMTPALAEAFVTESIAAMGRAQKGKGKA